MYKFKMWRKQSQAILKQFSLYFLRGQKKSLLYLAHTGAKIFQKMHFRIEVKIIDASIFSYNQIQVISCEPEL